ncbi:MAG TPA: gliding motility-associated C-terminal domain-containing protein, partial [Brumimicrobium sp.]|nr:gliding motility-associated C-terminal domain-containing protein [Brumimicrobium sp.]
PGGTFSFVPQTNDGATIDSLTGIISNGVGGTTYAVEYLTPGSCPSFSVVELTVIEQPSVGISANPTQGNSPLTVDFTNHSIGGDNYTWYFEEGSSLSNNNDFLTYTFYEEGTYVVFLIGEAGDGMCTDTSTIEIIVQAEEMVYEFPNVFTPNNDFINDNFQFVHHKNIESLEIIILNRWGNLVFESNEINFKWDGTVLDSGTECVDGTYFYKANIKNSAGKVVQEHGYVRLVRE